jgi:hypothetical protein
VARILKDERDIVIAARPLEATTVNVEGIRWTYEVPGELSSFKFARQK